MAAQTHLLVPTSWKNRLNLAVLGFGHRLLRCFPPEFSHDLAMRMLARGSIDRFLKENPILPYGQLRTVLPGIGDLIHPIGLAAGFDKQAEAPAAFRRMGFSMIEVGTITPQPQPGNPKPRMWRLSDQRALINCMGFNSHGSQIVRDRLAALNWSHTPVPLGINLGKNKSTASAYALQDYLHGLEAFFPFGRYFVMNLSSPNTPGLRDLANAEFIENLAASVGQNKYKVWFKLDPDMSKEDFQKTVEVIATCGFQGIVLTNTHRVEWPYRGGLSGHPLSALSSRALDWAYEVHRGRLNMIASGGILSGVDVFDRLARGANAVQIYSALVYRGPWTVYYLLAELLAEMRLHGMSELSQLIGSQVESKR